MEAPTDTVAEHGNIYSAVVGGGSGGLGRGREGWRKGGGEESVLMQHTVGGPIWDFEGWHSEKGEMMVELIEEDFRKGMEPKQRRRTLQLWSRETDIFEDAHMYRSNAVGFKNQFERCVSVAATGSVTWSQETMQ